MTVFLSSQCTIAPVMFNTPLYMSKLYHKYANVFIMYVANEIDVE